MLCGIGFSEEAKLKPLLHIYKMPGGHGFRQGLTVEDRLRRRYQHLILG